MYTLVLIRHGESVWNKENRFTGWKDVQLSAQGQVEGVNAGKVLKDEGFEFDIAYTSVLRRAIGTLWLVLTQMELMWIPVNRAWELNERHYGALQGLNKAETAEKHGDDQVKIWRRSYDVPPPALEKDDERWPGHDRRYADLDPSLIPVTECLKDTVERVVPYWDNEIAPKVKAGKRIIIAAHGNSLRALVKHLDGMSDEDIVEVNIPTGMPLVYKLDENLKPISKNYLGDKDAVEKAMKLVAAQGKSK